MNWDEAVARGNLIYEFKSTWTLKKTICDVSFYQEFPLTNIDSVICSIIDVNSGEIDVNTLATVLGFNIQDDLNSEPKRYRDEAEEEIFYYFVDQVSAWGLIKKYNESLSLTQIGRRSLNTHKKFKFYAGKKVLFENFNIKPNDDPRNLFFPFHDSLGVFSEITNLKEVAYNTIDIESVFDIEINDLIRRHNLQSKEIYNLFQSILTPYFEIEGCEIVLRLYEHQEQYFPIVLRDNEVSKEATDLLNRDENCKHKGNKIQEGLYKKLLADPNAILNYANLMVFEDLLNIDSLVTDKRLVWGDPLLFKYLAARANSNQWFKITSTCDIATIKLHLPYITEQIDWSLFTQRVDDDFLLEEATRYPWDFQNITGDETRDMNVITRLMLNPGIDAGKWDMIELSPRLDTGFILIHIDKFDFDLTNITQNQKEEAKALIEKHTEKRWDWDYICSEYELSYILEKINILAPFLRLKALIERVFSDPIWSISYSQSNDFKEILINAKSDQLSDYVITLQNYCWSETLIDFLDETPYLLWGSTRYIAGFECNDYVNWTYYLFGKYHNKIISENGYSNISSSIRDSSIIDEYPDFEWDWEDLSENKAILSDPSPLVKYSADLNWSKVLQNIEANIIEKIFWKGNVFSSFEQGSEVWKLLTELCSVEFVRANIDLFWDWEILTSRFYSSIKISALGNDKWRNKWDWAFLTSNIDNETLEEFIDVYSDCWDWPQLTRRIGKSYILSNLEKYGSFWDWKYLISDLFSKDDLFSDSMLEKISQIVYLKEPLCRSEIWHLITRKFEFLELKTLIERTYENHKYEWDLAYFSTHPDFKVRQYLKDCGSYIDWTSLSSSENLNKDFRFDKELFTQEVWFEDIMNQLTNSSYSWDFKALSKIASINWNERILYEFRTKWDWNYLSLSGSFFSNRKWLLHRIKRFERYTNFQLFSSRSDTIISEELLLNYPDKNWNWKVLSNNPSVKLTMDFIRKYPNKDYDWGAISGRSDFHLDNAFLVTFSEMPWDWGALSQRMDISFDQDLIRSLSEKPLNWYLISQRKDFIPDQSTISILVNKDLDWSAISRNENFEVDLKLLLSNRNKIDWYELTRNKRLNLSDDRLLGEFSDVLDWQFISESASFKPKIENLLKFKKHLFWEKVNARDDLQISLDHLEDLKDVLDWKRVSKSMDLFLTEELIEKYKEFWNWLELCRNPQVIDRLDTALIKYKPELNVVRFLNLFEIEYRVPRIYHFSHLFNAVEIIKKRKICSRKNMEDGKFSNSASIIVDRRNDAHNYARFYFRPKTPTQFYNECLGWDSQLGSYKTWHYYGYHSKWKTYYPQAKDHGLPKCPLPVFFEFDLQEVLQKMKERCYYSDGNMQTNRARIFKVTEQPEKLNVNNLYATIEDGVDIYKQYSQQEFLVLNEFDFSDLQSLKIVCYDDQSMKLLKRLLGNDRLSDKIISNGNTYFNRTNRELHISREGNVVDICSDYLDDAYLALRSPDLRSIKILNPENIKKETDNEVITYPSIRFEEINSPIEVHFVDITLKKQDWLVYSNSISQQSDEKIHSYKDPSDLISYLCTISGELEELYDSQVRHYTVRAHTLLVCRQFELYFADCDLGLNKDIFRIFLALHDIGKPSAERKGNRKDQYRYTIEIIKDVFAKLSYDESDTAIVLALASGDYIGEYFQGKHDVNETLAVLIRLSNSINMAIPVFFKLFMIYYQCDTSAYTSDGGGLRYLEYLFVYENGRKIFDNNEGLIRMSSMYWEKYFTLKNAIKNGD